MYCFDVRQYHAAGEATIAVRYFAEPMVNHTAAAPFGRGQRAILCQEQPHDCVF